MPFQFAKGDDTLMSSAMIDTFHAKLVNNATENINKLKSQG